jgi:hypothetical protein
MQKLASSSVAAIRRALKNRLARIKDARQQLTRMLEEKALLQRYEELEADDDLDDVNEMDEQIAERTTELSLMEDEESRLIELIEAAEAAAEETKIQRILSVLDERFSDRSVLFFTEYKATQSLLMSALLAKYGVGCVTFINGDGRADGVCFPSGEARSITEDRATASAKFNDGNVRFLVSTEAAGEGIDLQEKCHTLIHVDLPWNPMRLHQRVGRLNRYGQSKRVEVMTLRNPSTVESRIWDKLYAKIDSIMQSLGEVMDEPEDLLELVLGMTSPKMFREVFSGAAAIPEGSLTKWFDEKTATFGGQDVLKTVRGLVGHCAQFDFQEVSAKIPRLDLPALKPFFLAMLALNRRKYQESERGLSFKTPEAWLTTPAIRTNYRDVIFERSPDKSVASDRILGIGHTLVDQAIRQARDGNSSVTAIPRILLSQPLVVFRILDKVTSRTKSVRSVVVGAEVDESKVELLTDWVLFARLNELLAKRTLRRDEAMERPSDADQLPSIIERGLEAIVARQTQFDLPFDVPEVHLLAAFWPSARELTEPDESRDDQG